MGEDPRKSLRPSTAGLLEGLEIETEGTWTQQDLLPGRVLLLTQYRALSFLSSPAVRKNSGSWPAGGDEPLTLCRVALS